MYSLDKILDGIDRETREKIIAHVETALKFERNRQPVLAIDSRRPTQRIICTMCNAGIRPETTPVSGMHPRCAKVHDDPRNALTMPVNGMAARALLDALYVSLKRENVDIERENARKQAHAEMLKRFELAETEREFVENTISLAAKRKQA